MGLTTGTPGLPQQQPGEVGHGVGSGDSNHAVISFYFLKICQLSIFFWQSLYCCSRCPGFHPAQVIKILAPFNSAAHFECMHQNCSFHGTAGVGVNTGRFALPWRHLHLGRVKDLNLCSTPEAAASRGEGGFEHGNPVWKLALPEERHGLRRSRSSCRGPGRAEG